MPDSRPSIAEFSSLVEKLASLLPVGAGQGDPASFFAWEEVSLRGRRLDELLRERWPYARAWAGRPLSQGCLEAAQRRARQDKDGLLAEIARRKRDMAKALEGLRRAQDQAAKREALAAGAWNASLAAVPRLQAACLEVRSRLRARREEAAKLETWLKRVEPHGLNRYRHPQGRVFDRPFLTQTVAHLQQIRDLARRDQRRLEVLTRSLSRARARRERAGRGLDQAQNDLRQFQAARQRKTLALQKERAEVARLEARLADVQRELGRLTALRLLHGRALAQAGALLAPALAPRAAAPDPLAAVEEHRRDAQDLAARAARWQGLIARLEKRLQRRAEDAAQGLKQARDLNREIARLEDDLPRIVGPLTSPEGAQAQVRAAAAAQLSTLLPRLNELLPQALELRRDLDLLRGQIGRAHV
jgi:DNA repair exonuclease SbcCD ATPase subunit